MFNPTLSVIMSVYNDEEYVAEAIDSVLSQTYKDFEFIIVDDGSTDTTSKILESYESKDSRIKVLYQKNQGLTKSLNNAIKIAQGSYIARMDSDDISHSLRFEKQILFFQEHQEYALVGTNIIKIDKDGKKIETNTTSYSYEEIVKTFEQRNCIAHGSVMLNKLLLGEKLHYDETFLYAQDFKLWAEIAKEYKICNLKESLYSLRVHEKSISKKKIEQQSIYAAVVAYEFQNHKKIVDISKELKRDRKLRKKVGIILLMNFQPLLARHYFNRFDLYYYISIFLEHVDMKRVKNMIKRFI